MDKERGRSESRQDFVSISIVVPLMTMMLFFWLIGTQLKDAQRRIAVLEQRLEQLK